MESNKTVAYVITKRKFSDSDSITVESSSDSVKARNSTSFSSRSSLTQFFNSDHKPSPLNLLSDFPLTKVTSKALQQKISKADPSELSSILASFLPKMPDMMIDAYGNYLCQTLFHTCSGLQRLELLKSLKGSMVSIAYNSRGTHALQNLIALNNLKEEENIYKEEFSGSVVAMSKNINASHVVQRLLMNLNNKYFVISEVLGSVRELAIDKFGVCVLKKCCNDPEVIGEVLGDTLMLIQHPYGNYIIQSVLEIWKEEIAADFFSSIKGRVTQLCLQKYSSNVIEKALKVENIKEGILKEILAEGKIKEIVGNQYGCYVLRTLAGCCNNYEKFVLGEEFMSSTQGIFTPKLKSLWQEISQLLSRS